MKPTELSALIATRRNVKPEGFEKKQIPQEVLQPILESANWAPTHGYTEPWRFVVFTGKSLIALGDFLARLDQPNANAEDFNEVRFKRLASRPSLASHVIGIAMKRGDNPKIPEVEEVCSVAMAVQNMWLMAHSYGIGAYWSTGAKGFSDELRDFMNLDENHHAMGLFYLGYPAEALPAGRRVSSIDEKISFM